MSVLFVTCEQCGTRSVVKLTAGLTNPYTQRVTDKVTQVVDCPCCGLREQHPQPVVASTAL